MNQKLSDPKKTIEVIQKYQFAFQKRFGQNFLIDAHVLEKIVSAVSQRRHYNESLGQLPYRHRWRQTAH